MAYEKTWRFAPSYEDYVPSDTLDGARHRLWTMKSFLKGEIGGATLGLWTCVGSSDGVTAGLDGTDRWTTTYTPSLLVRGALGAARSWMVLQSPGLMNGFTWYILLSYGNTANDYNYGFRYSQDAYTGGSTTVSPTAPNELNSSSYSTMANGLDYLVNNNFATARIRSHGILSSTGDFILMQTRAGATYGNDIATYFIAPVGCSVADLWPIWAGCKYGAANNNDALSSYALGSPGNGGGVVTRLHDRTIAQPPDQYLGTVMEWTGNDVVTGKLIDTPSWIFVKASNTLGMARGRLPDIGVIGAGNSGTAPAPNGSTVRDGSNNITYIVSGGLLIPFDSVPDYS